MIAAELHPFFVDRDAYILVFDVPSSECENIADKSRNIYLARLMPL
jgi:hypothetical protein